MYQQLMPAASHREVSPDKGADYVCFESCCDQGRQLPLCCEYDY